MARLVSYIENILGLQYSESHLAADKHDNPLFLFMVSDDPIDTTWLSVYIDAASHPDSRRLLGLNVHFVS